MNAPRVKVLYFAGLRDAFGTSEMLCNVEEGMTLGQLSKRLFDEHPEARGMAASLAYGVNFEYAGLDRVLQAGDEVAFIPPVAGGAHD